MPGNNLFDLRQLEAFSAVISAGSVTGAAKLIGKSQPVVTRLIQELETELGFDLFARHGRRVTPTQVGVDFYREVERLLASAERTRQRAADLASRQTEAIEIATTSSLASAVVPGALRLLRDRGQLPRNVLVRTQTPEEVIQTVAARGADIGIASLPIDHPAVDVKWIAEAHCVCVLPEDDPLAAEEVVEVAALSRRDLITPLNPYRILSRITAALERSDAHPARVIRSNASLTAIQLARHGLGIAVIEPLSADALPLPGVVVRPLDVPIPFLWGIISPLGLPELPVAPHLIEALVAAGTRDLPGFRVRDVREIEAILKNPDGL